MSATPLSAIVNSFPNTSAAPVFAALGDARRLQILHRLGYQGAMSITEIASGAAITRQAITKHLHVLNRAGLVHGSKQGRQQVWELNLNQLAEARRCLEQISEQWEQALHRLKNLVEGDES
jgi:DNA-binding transcriptional ArsR family regulator